MKPAVSTLTEDQAVEELGQILDSAPDETDVLALHHWKQENSARAQQLEFHIMHLQKGTKPELQDAPPHHLQPEPAKASAIAKEKPVSAKKTPKEKLDHLMTAWIAAWEATSAAPSDRALRDKASSIRSQMKVLCASFKIHMPDLTPLPALPDPKPKGGARVVDKKPAPPAPVAEKAGPGPYEPPTAQDLRELLHQVDPAASFEEVLTQLEQVAPPRAVSGTIELVQDAPDPLLVRATIRQIRRDTMACCWTWTAWTTGSAAWCRRT